MLRNFLLRKPVLLSFVAGLSIGVAGTVIGATIRFPDVPQDAYFKNAVDDMVALGIITGFQDGTFRPNEALTRGQAAVMFQRLVKLMDVEIPEDGDGGAAVSRRSRGSAATSATSSSSSSSTSATSTATGGGVPEQGLLRFTTASYKENEGTPTARITVVRTGGKKGAVTVEYALTDGTAKAGSDFESLTGTLNFGENETTKSFDVKLTNDTESEGNENFMVELKNATNGAGVTEPKLATFTILDDENGNNTGGTTQGATSGPDAGVFNYGASEYSIKEDASSFTVTVERNKTKGSVAVNYATSDNTAKAGSEYTSTSGTLSFGDGENSKTFTVTISNNGALSGNKMFNLVLSAPTGGALLGINQKAVVKIQDDENDAITFGSGSLRFSDDLFEVIESDGNAIITIERISGTKGTASVAYKTSGGSAQSNNDFTPVDSTMTFRPGESKKTFLIPILKDTISDGEETVTLGLSNVVGAGLASPSTATLKIY